MRAAEDVYAKEGGGGSVRPTRRSGVIALLEENLGQRRG